MRVKTVCGSPPLLQNPDRVLRPAASELWRTDGKRVAAAGGRPYLHGLMDAETRPLLSVEAAGIVVRGSNGWMTLLRNSNARKVAG